MKLYCQKAYHQSDPALWECMTEQEREEYHAFLADNEKLLKEILNHDRSYKRKVKNIGDSNMLTEFADGDERLNIKPSRGIKEEPKSPDFLDLIKRNAYDRDGKIYFSDELIESIMDSLSEKQRKVLEYSVIYEIPTKVIAAMEGCTDRNIRKLRERGLDNLCKKYAERLRQKSSLTLHQRKFLEWVDAGKPELPEPAPIPKKEKPPDPLLARYEKECGSCVTVVPRKSESA